MEILKTVDLMKRWSRATRGRGLTIGLVPTMGYLHEGHLSLMRRARLENERLAVSIFVNPTQFGPTEDLDSYPRDPESDSRKCEEVGVDALFMPEPGDVYGPDFQTTVSVGPVASPLCGASRPGHFQGVATVVLKLFNIVNPHAAYFGSKDYQQLQVIKTMAQDLDSDVRVVSCGIVREEDGVAMSSRNKYLSNSERKQAVALFEALRIAETLFKGGEAQAAAYVEAMTERIEQEPDAEVDYVSLAHPETLVDLDRVDGRALAALAVKIGKTRLIDNLLME